MKVFLVKLNKFEIEKIVVGIYSLKLKDINNFQVVQVIFKNKIFEVIVFIKEIDLVQYFIFLGNLFNGNIKDCYDCDYVVY